MSIRLAVALLASVSLCCACGGGSGGDADGPVFNLAPTLPDGEGWGAVGGATDNTAQTMPVGDTVANGQVVGLLCFDISGTSNLQSATLRFSLVGQVGNPVLLNPLVLDHINGGGTLDAGDANGGAIDEAFEALAPAAVWVVDVTDQVIVDLNAGRSESTFRIRYTNPTNANLMLDASFIATSKHPNADLHPRLELISNP